MSTSTFLPKSVRSLPRQAGFPLSIPFLYLSAGLAAVSLVAYLLASYHTYRLGFPLDDAWIHQTYARNLALHGEWAFLPGQASGGSTAPLWTLLLSAGSVLGLAPYVWTLLLGWGVLWSLAGMGSRSFRVFSPDLPGWAPWAGVLLILEWHLVWAAASGMETLLLALLALVAITWVEAGWKHWGWLGLLIGATVWVRPDGLTLLGPAALALLAKEESWRRRLRSLVWLGLGFGLLFVPYLIFNQLAAGAWWPTTFYAKQAEYAVYQNLPVWSRFAAQGRELLRGVGIVLLPGLVLFAWKAYKRRAWGSLAGVLWMVTYLGLYAWRLPVVYQHGRYLIPVLPVALVWGLAGLATATRSISTGLVQWAAGRAWLVSCGVVLVLYWGFGAHAYAGDVAVIESEMVNTARWVAEHTEPEALVAAHDIGALGYFGNRRLLDLAGLISPEVIPFIRDEPHLAEYLDEQGASYLVTFPGWYPDLVGDLSPVYQSDGVHSPRLGGENMAVYGWPAASEGDRQSP